MTSSLIIKMFVTLALLIAYVQCNKDKLVTINEINIFDNTFIKIKDFQGQMPQKICRWDHSKLTQISNLDDITLNPEHYLKINKQTMIPTENCCNLMLLSNDRKSCRGCTSSSKCHDNKRFQCIEGLCVRICADHQIMIGEVCVNEHLNQETYQGVNFQKQEKKKKNPDHKRTQQVFIEKKNIEVQIEQNMIDKTKQKIDEMIGKTQQKIDKMINKTKEKIVQQLKIKQQQNKKDEIKTEEQFQTKPQDKKQVQISQKDQIQNKIQQQKQQQQQQQTNQIQDLQQASQLIEITKNKNKNKQSQSSQQQFYNNLIIALLIINIIAVTLLIIFCVIKLNKKKKQLDISNKKKCHTEKALGLNKLNNTSRTPQTIICENQLYGQVMQSVSKSINPMRERYEEQ